MAGRLGASTRGKGGGGMSRQRRKKNDCEEGELVC